ncbi:MAG TPA: hypothetical protein VJ870_12000 [Amycolatopsis sp.]|nr:hypothetical protein [Amycolatopsis sp.]
MSGPAPVPDHTVPALRAAVTAMNEIVIPAVDPEHPLAREQATIVSGLLAMLAERVLHLHARADFETEHFRDVAVAVADDAAEVSPSLAGELATLVDDRSAVTTSALEESAARLAQNLTALVRTAGRSDTSAARRIEATVLDRSGALLDARRAWFLPQGWETDAAAVPALESVLSTVRTSRPEEETR